jgi:large subunit ribosomal protein L25
MKTDTLKVDSRDTVGKLATRRLRDEGKLPAVLYGHGEPTVNLTMCRDALRAAVRHHSRIVQLEGAETGQALLQELQWDTFGREVLHVDLLRVVKGERLTVEVEVKGKGEAAGEQNGGVVEHVRHTVEIEVNPAAMPDVLHVNLQGLEVGGTVTAGAIYDLPESAKLLTGEDEVLYTCNLPVEEAETVEETDTGTEPELVGGKEKEEDEEGEEKED